MTRNRDQIIEKSNISTNVLFKVQTLTLTLTPQSHTTKASIGALS